MGAPQLFHAVVGHLVDFVRQGTAPQNPVRPGRRCPPRGRSDALPGLLFPAPQRGELDGPFLKLVPDVVRGGETGHSILGRPLPVALVATIAVEALALELALQLVLAEQRLQVPLSYQALDVGLGATKAEVEVAQNKNPIEHVVNHLAGLKSHNPAVPQNPPDVAVPTTPVLGVRRKVAVGKQHGSAPHVHGDVDSSAITKQSTEASGDVRGTDTTDVGSQLVAHKNHEVHAAQTLATDHVVAIPKNLSHLLLPSCLGPSRRTHQQIAVAEPHRVEVMGDLWAQEGVQLLRVPRRSPAKNTPDTHKNT
mmetsp:Transcript_49561/g.112575  ORF Transcript_49561/g.112575 Transcript_49561/m.112575 type:complete len:308 (-) Transcript_49561:934-1857(-)